MRIAVLGGTEFIGRNIVEGVVARGDQVLIVHRGITEPDDWVSCQHLHVDRANFSAVAPTVRDFRPDAVVDACAMTADDVAAVLPYLPDVPSIVLSSQDVYLAFQLVLRGGAGEQPVPIDEDGLVRTKRYPYRGIFAPDDDTYEKLDVEPAYLARGGTVLRLPRVYGPHDAQRREEPVLRRVRAGRRAIPIGSGNLLWSKSYVAEVSRSVLCVLDQPEAAAAQVFNVNEYSSVTMRRWYEQILAAADATSVELVTVPDDVVPPDLRFTTASRHHLLMDAGKIDRLLGWRHRNPEEAVAESVEWHLTHPPESDGEFASDDKALRHVQRSK
jgi:nucleoside-diphosphate-sugar epimerase